MVVRLDQVFSLFFGRLVKEFFRQLEGAIDLILLNTMVHNVKEPNGLAGLENLLSNLLWILVKVSKVNDRNFMHHGCCVKGLER